MGAHALYFRIDAGAGVGVGSVPASKVVRPLASSTVCSTTPMAPEQTLGDAVDQRTDIWALGVVLYEMVSGRRPFDGGHSASTLHAVAYEQPVPLTSLRAGVPIDLDRIVMRALAKSPNGRY